MNGKGRTQDRNLTPKQVKALGLLMSGHTVASVAAAVGVRRQTISEWRHVPKFREALQAAENESLADLSRALGVLAMGAVGVLGQTMTDAKASDAVKVRAAGIVLSRKLQAVILVDLEKQLRDLEDVVGADGAEPEWSGDDDG